MASQTNVSPQAANAPEQTAQSPAAVPSGATSAAPTIRKSAGLTLVELQTAVLSLNQADLCHLLTQLPAHQLAAALEKMLRPIAPAQQPSVPVQPTDAAGQPSQAYAQPQPNEKRTADRKRTLRAAKIVYNNNMSVASCELRDISETGCRIAIESTAYIPNHFVLHVTNSGIRHECEVAWRKSNMMGVRFLT